MPRETSGSRRLSNRDAGPKNGGCVPSISSARPAASHETGRTLQGSDLHKRANGTTRVPVRPADRAEATPRVPHLSGTQGRGPTRGRRPIRTPRVSERPNPIGEIDLQQITKNWIKRIRAEREAERG